MQTALYIIYYNILLLQVVSRRCSLTGECSTSPASQHSSRCCLAVLMSISCRPRPPMTLVSHTCVATDAVGLWTRPIMCVTASVDTAGRCATLVSLSSRRWCLFSALFALSDRAVSVVLWLTRSTPAGPNCCCSKGSAPYWSNPPFSIFDIRVLWRSALSARAPECQKLKMVG